MLVFFSFKFSARGGPVLWRASFKIRRILLMAVERGYHLFLKAVTVLTDILIIFCSFLMAYLIRFKSGLIPVTLGVFPMKLYIEAFSLSTLVLVLVLNAFGFYRKKESYNPTFIFVDVIKAVSIGFIIMMAMTYVYHREFSYSRILIVLAWMLSILFLTLSRTLLENIERWIAYKKQDKKKVLVIGTGDMAKRLIKNLRLNPFLGYEVAGILAENDRVSRNYIFGKKILGHIGDIDDILNQQKFHEVILTLPNMKHDNIVDIILKCERNMIRFKMIPDIFEIITSCVEVDNIDGVPILGLKEFPLEKPLNRFMKRLFDIAGSSLGLALTAPLFPILGYLIKRDSKGPVFYKQTRIGEDGREFNILKFRTMKINAEKESGPVWAKKEDPRRTKIGGFLRKFNLDEIPQLINVFKGDMSMVGPRPERPHFVAEFKENIPRYMSRHIVKSGITGWAQVNGLRGDTSIEQRIKYDLYYMENWSLLFDAKIIMMTFFARENAY
ncbi:undecaprenyl-phosphate glucose phosphotransferase [Chlamydiota bacterium]